MHVTGGVARLISGRAQPGLLTALLEYLTFLFKYFDVFQYQWQGHSKHLGGPGPWQAQPWMPHISCKLEQENLVNPWNSPKYFPPQFVCVTSNKCTGPCCDSIYLMQGDD